MQKSPYKDFWLRLIGIPALSLVIPPLFFADTFYDWPTYWSSVFVSFVFTFTLWTVCRQFIVYFTKRYPTPEDNTKRLVFIGLSAAGFTLVSCDIIHNLLDFLPPELHRMHDPSAMQKYGSAYILSLTVGAIYESMRFFDLWKKTLTEKEQLERAHLASQLEGLRNQVNPHFLFNSLNTLTYLIPEDPERAVRFVQQLSKVYRYVLESRDANIIPLETELEFLKSYIFLLRERFGENLQVEIGDFSGRKSAAVVPLSLQMLFENVIKHNIISADKPLTIHVFAENGSLVVRNNLQQKKQVMDSTGVGLENIRTRYRMLTGRDVEVVASPQHFTVLLPLVKLEHSV